MLQIQTANEFSSSSYAIGVDIGGTHITAGVIDLQKRSVVKGSEVRAFVNAQGKADDILSVWLDVIEQAVQKITVPLKGIGFAMPGPFDYISGVSLIKNMHKYEALYGLNIKELLAGRLHIAPGQIQMRNDAEAFMAGEVMGGAAFGFNHAIGLTLGTGLGSAKSHYGVAVDVNLGSSSFLDGIAEDYMSTRWFIKRYHEFTGSSIKGVKELFENPSNDSVVQQLLQEFCTHLALFLEKFIKQEAAEVVVIGGSISHAFPLFYPKLCALLPKALREVVIKRAALGEAAALIGAVSCWIPIDEAVPHL